MQEKKENKIGKEYYDSFLEASKSWVPVLHIKRDRTSPEWFAFIRYIKHRGQVFILHAFEFWIHRLGI